MTDKSASLLLPDRHGETVIVVFVVHWQQTNLLVRIETYHVGAVVIREHYHLAQVQRVFCVVRCINQ